VFPGPNLEARIAPAPLVEAGEVLDEPVVDVQAGIAGAGVINVDAPGEPVESIADAPIVDVEPEPDDSQSAVLGAAGTVGDDGVSENEVDGNRLDMPPTGRVARKRASPVRAAKASRARPRTPAPRRKEPARRKANG
jgi:hypothetical protein